MSLETEVHKDDESMAAKLRYSEAAKQSAIEDRTWALNELQMARLEISDLRKRWLMGQTRSYTVIRFNPDRDRDETWSIGTYTFEEARAKVIELTPKFPRCWNFRIGILSYYEDEGGLYGNAPA